MATPHTLTFRRARDITLLVGLMVIALVTLSMVLRDVDPIEITATIAFAPVFVAFLFFGWRVGLGIGVLAAATYIAMRIPAIRIVGLGPLFGTLTTRVIGFLVFGGVGGWAAEQLQASIDKLELHDEIDDATGLGNARSVVNVLTDEKARSARYEKFSSVIDCRFEMPNGVSNRTTAATIRQLGSVLSHSIRTSDHVAHIDEEGLHRVVMVLPETGAAGASTVASNLDREIRARFGVSTETAVMTLPDDLEQVDVLIDAMSKHLRQPGRAST